MTQQIDTKQLARELIAEFRSVKLDAKPGMASGTKSSPKSSINVWTGSLPARIEIFISEAGGYAWQVSDRDHGHSLPLDTPIADLAELVSMCFARHCVAVAKLNESRTEAGPTKPVQVQP